MCKSRSILCNVKDAKNENIDTQHQCTLGCNMYTTQLYDELCDIVINKIAYEGIREDITTNICDNLIIGTELQSKTIIHAQNIDNHKEMNNMFSHRNVNTNNSGFIKEVNNENICECSNDKEEVPYNSADHYMHSNAETVKECISIAHWNVNGWTDENEYLREFIIRKLCPDIISINETWLRNNNQISVLNDMYEWIGYNRDVLHRNAARGSGGAGLFIKHVLYNDWEIDTVDKSFEGILGVQFSNKHTDYKFIMFSCYLPPEGYSRGHDGSSFYQHLLNLTYLYADVDAMYIVGDLNSRIGSDDDHIPELDDIPVRVPLDIHGKVNKHGECLLDFLKDTKMCIINGRVTPDHDDFTYISSRGKSVVDYFIVPHEQINDCKSMDVYTMKNLVNRFNLNSCITDLKHIPDHSVLLAKCSFVCEKYCEDGNVNPKPNQETKCNFSEEHPDYFRRYKRNLPEDWMNSSETIQDMLTLIEDALLNRITQNKIDHIYEEFCTLYHNEMKKHLKYIDSLPGGCRRYKLKPKPWWNDGLEQLWKNLVIVERMLKKNITKCKRKNARKQEEYKVTQRKFDKAYRKDKRQFYRDKQMYIESVYSNNPRQFWKEIDKLGPPRKRRDIPLETYREDGTLIRDVYEVLDIWKDKFQSLYTPFSDNNFNVNLYNCRMEELECMEERMCDNANDSNVLNYEINCNEVYLVIMAAKNNKSIGIDNLPYEIFKKGHSVTLLHKLFNLIFNSSIIPSIWLKAIIKPIPKSTTSDPRLPLMYRGISLLSTVSKLYSGILNNRLSKFSEENNLFVEEQNGFRKKRSCEEHIYTLSSLIRKRKGSGLSTYVAFIDIEKAFDKVDRKLLLYKLLKLNVNGKFYHSIKNMYSNNQYTIGINKLFTPWFEANMGIRQGDCLSSTLFALFINDLAIEIKKLNKGIDINGYELCLLLFADDIALISDSEEHLQEMLNCVHNWCNKWRLRVNCKKTKVVHFRTLNESITKFSFTYGHFKVETVSSYKYLGIIFDEHLSFNLTAEALSGAAGRALGKLFSVYKGFKGMGYNSFTKLYESYVEPIMTYSSSIWGYKQFHCCDSIQNRAIRGFLGVHRFAPKVAINGDMGWIGANVKRKLCMIRLWNKLVCMNNNRLPKIIFNWDHEKKSIGWCQDIKKLLNSLNRLEDYEQYRFIITDVIKFELHCKYMLKWKEEVSKKEKLRTYTRFKYEYGTEKYVSSLLSKGQRSILAQFRSGILPLKIETGRYTDTPIQLRTCDVCTSNSIEDEMHFLLECDLYKDERELLYSKVRPLYENFDEIDDDVKLLIFMNDEDLFGNTARYLTDAYKKRSMSLCL